MASAKKSGKSTKGTKSDVDIMSEFQELRNEQRKMANKLSEIEMELNEHKTVIDTLKNVDPKRKSYIMTGGILCQQTVEDVLPGLVSNKELLIKLIDSLNDQLTKKGIEINEFKEKHNIRIRGQQDLQRHEEEKSKDAKNTTVVRNSMLSDYA